MDALEAFAQVVGFWPNSFKPRDAWKPAVIEELEGWDATDRASIVRSLQAVMGRNKTVDLETLRKARNNGAVTRGNANGNTGGNTERHFLERLGLIESFKSQHIGDRIMISRLIRCVMNNPGWEGVLEEQAGSAQDFKSWERIENLIRAAEAALIPVSDTKGIKACYPKLQNDGQAYWAAPTDPVNIVLPRPRKRKDYAADRAGVDMIFKIANKYGGFKIGSSSGASEIYNSPEYQAYLKDYTDRTGLAPA